MRRLGGLVAVGALLMAARGFAVREAYDPLRIGAAFQPERVSLTAHDVRRKRDIPLRVYLPSATNAAPVVLFSHGLGGSCENNPYLGNHWAARGYVAVFLQHAGSDSAVWKGAPANERMGSLRDAADGKNFMLRMEDVSAVLDQLAEWNAEKGQVLAGRLDLSRVGMSGHSFGAVTTQAVSGQTFLLGGKSFRDARIKAAVAFSPSAPRLGNAEKAFGKVEIPWLLMTGTKDVAPVGNIGVQSRLSVFPALPPGGKYELVLENAEHSAFGDRPLPMDKEPRNPNHHRAVLALSTAFWDAYLCGDALAKTWLDGDGPRSVLEPKDRWQKK